MKTIDKIRGILYGHFDAIQLHLGEKVEIPDLFDGQFLPAIMSVRRLAMAHKRQCENSCNGEGFIPRKGFFRCDNPGAYVSADVTVFDQEIERIEDAIIKAVEHRAGFAHTKDPYPLTVEFQHDPRGLTVRLFFLGRDISYVDISNVLYE